MIDDALELLPGHGIGVGDAVEVAFRGDAGGQVGGRKKPPIDSLQQLPLEGDEVDDPEDDGGDVDEEDGHERQLESDRHPVEYPSEHLFNPYARSVLRRTLAATPSVER